MMLVDGAALDWDTVPDGGDRVFQHQRVVGEPEHGGSRHLIIRKPSDGAKCLLPEWMPSPAAGVIRIVSCPRLSVNRLVELRGLIDRLMASSPSGKHNPGGPINDTMDAARTGPVQDVDAERTVGIPSTNKCTGAAEDASDGGDLHHRSRKHRSGGRR